MQVRVPDCFISSLVDRTDPLASEEDNVVPSIVLRAYDWGGAQNSLHSFHDWRDVGGHLRNLGFGDES